MTFVNMLRYVAERWQTQFQNFHRIICRLWMRDLKHAGEDDVVFSWFVVEQIYEDHSDPARQRFYHNTLLSPPLKACPHVYKSKFLPGQIALQRRYVMTHTDCAVAGMEECWSKGVSCGPNAIPSAAWDFVGRRSFVVTHKTQGTFNRMTLNFILKQRGTEPPQPVTRPRENVVTSCAAKTWRDITVVNTRRTRNNFINR